MSFDSVQENKAFAEKFQFPFKLLCDTDRKIGMAYGAATSQDAGYAARIAYTIENGKITHAEKVTDPAGHAQACLIRVSS